MTDLVQLFRLPAGGALKAIACEAREIAVRQQVWRLPVVIIVHKFFLAFVFPFLTQQQLGKCFTIQLTSPAGRLSCSPDPPSRSDRATLRAPKPVFQRPRGL